MSSDCMVTSCVHVEWLEEVVFMWSVYCDQVLDRDIGKIYSRLEDVGGLLLTQVHRILDTSWLHFVLDILMLVISLVMSRCSLGRSGSYILM